jgi:hypothetical protein
MNPVGPFAWHSSIYPNGHWVGDLTVFADPASAYTEAYLIYSVRPGGADGHKRDIIVAKLDPSWLGVQPTQVSEITDPREAPAAFFADGIGYFIWTSHVTGWEPNAAAVYHSKSLAGPWNAIGNPTENATSFRSQSTCACWSCVICVPGTKSGHALTGLLVRLRFLRRYPANQCKLFRLHRRPIRAVCRSEVCATLRLAANHGYICNGPHCTMARHLVVLKRSGLRAPQK